MSKIVVIADDLTGANATSILLKKNGYKAATFLGIDAYKSSDTDNLDVISVSTDTRAVEQEVAYKIVSNLVNCFKDEKIEFFSKRIDSTLRGNIGSEVKAVLDKLDKSAMAMVVPSYPASGRIVIGGNMLVDGQPLSRTSVARDPKTPIHHNSVRKIIEESYKEEIAYISLDDIEKGASFLKEKILEKSKLGIRLVIFDAVSDSDINTIAKAINMSQLEIVSVDPGPLTQALAREKFKKSKSNKKIMLTIGSVTDVTMEQILEFEKAEKVYFEEVDSLKLIYKEQAEEEIKRVSKSLIKNIDNFDLFGAISTKDKSNLLDLKAIGADLGIHEDQVSQRISQGLAKITENVMEAKSEEITGLYTSGGDITVAVCQLLDSVGIDMVDEVMPLAVYGKLKGGKYNGLPIVTKGGLIGNKKALIECVDFMRRR